MHCRLIFVRVFYVLIHLLVVKLFNDARPTGHIKRLLCTHCHGLLPVNTSLIVVPFFTFGWIELLLQEAQVDVVNHVDGAVKESNNWCCPGVTGRSLRVSLASH